MPSLNDLISQKTALDKQIVELQRAGRASAVTQIRSLMAEYSLSVADVLSPAEKRKMASGAGAACGCGAGGVCVGLGVAWGSSAAMAR